MTVLYITMGLMGSNNMNKADLKLNSTLKSSNDTIFRDGRTTRETMTTAVGADGGRGLFFPGGHSPETATIPMFLHISNRVCGRR